MVSIGVTGGIGSGKSLVCSLFKEMNIPIFFADDVANRIVSEEKFVQKAIKEAFGMQIFDARHALRRKELASIVFRNPTKLKELNAIIHPVVFDRFVLWEKEWKTAGNVPYALAESALMFESGFFKFVDYTIAVEAEESIRIARVQQRDSVGYEEVKERIQNQISPDELREEADFIIRNNGSIDDLRNKVKFFHAVFSNLKKRNEEQ